MSRAVSKQKSYIQRTLINDLAPFKATRDGSLEDSDFLKITDYYAFGVPSILGTAFATLRGTPVDENEQEMITSLGALTGLFDDFFDKKSLSDAEIQELINNPSRSKASTDSEKLFLHFYNKALAMVLDPETLKKAFFAVYQAQVESKEQFNDLSREKLEDITLKKGGLSLLFYRYAMHNSLSEDEKKLLYALGGLMQFGNDIFDVYKDTQAGIRTLPNTATSINQARTLFTSLLNEVYQLTQQTSFRKRDKNQFIRMISLGLSRCFVCLDQFERIERCSGGKFTPALYSRSDLICDMEKSSNLLRSLIYHIQYCK
ncbi:MAG TPA: hypothetical protein VHO72_07280 [Bacteroidales bacterium]|nr:hypothetical protein [Bacteroidales bacterium]